jgi:chromosome segregation ATPase
MDMKTLLFILPATLCVLVAVSAAPVAAQTTAQDRAASLRLQLADLQARQAELQARLDQLEENLKPENIEKSLAGVGSTHPEDLREQRRRELEIERTGLRTQLDLLAAGRTRLETGIAQADADAYRQSAGINAGGTTPQIGDQPGTINSPTLKRRPRRVNRYRPRTRPAPRRVRRTT